MKVDFGGADDIAFEQIGKAGVITLTRPKALNAVNHRMVHALTRALAAWEADESVALVVIKGEGRAFSAGGDILDIYNAGKAGNPPYDFFADEYRLNARIARFPKPYVALVDGIVMGGGVGVSFHGSHRVMTENAVFAMPEVGIGFFPDVGGSFLLSRMPNEFGLYAGLTGNRIRHGDALWSGLATHAVMSASLPLLVEELALTGNADAAIAQFAVEVERETDDATVYEISTLFGVDSLADLVAGLSQYAHIEDRAAGRILKAIGDKSPTSLNVAFIQIRTGAALSMDECMKMEFRILNRMLVGHDFYEGIRAAIIDKGTRPAWRPATLDAVDPDRIEAYFAPLDGGELVLE